MANSEEVDSLVKRDIVSKQITDTTQEVIALETALVDTAKGAAALNAELAKSGNFKIAQQSATAAATATARLQAEQAKLLALQEKIRAETAKAATAEARLEAQRAQNADKETRRQSKAAADAAKASALAAKQSSEYQKLVKAYNDATAAAREAGVVSGVNSAEFAAEAAEVQRLRAQLDAIDQPLGNYQRNVGNYANSIGSLFTRVYGYIRTAANILPGVGISGIFLLAFEGLKAVAEQLDLFSTKTTVAQNNLKNFNEVAKDASKQYGEQSTSLKILYQAATDVTNSIHNRTLAARELQKEFPDTFRNIKIETILNGDASKSYEQLTKDILDNAKAKAAANKISELAAKQLESDFKVQKINNAERNEQARLAKQLDANGDLSGIPGEGGGGILAGNADKQIKDRADKSRKIEAQNKKDLQAQIDFLVAFAGGNNKIAKALSTNDTPKDAKPKDDRKEILNQQLKDQQEQLEQVLNDEKSTFDQRLTAINKFEVESYIILNKGERDKVLTTIETENRIKGIENDAAKDRLKLNKDAQAELRKLLSDGAKKDAELQKEVLKNSLDVEAQFTAQRKTQIQKDADESLIAISEQYKKGLISKAEYEAQKLDITKQSQLDQDLADINGLKVRIGIELSLGEDALSDKEKLAIAERKLAKDTADVEIANAERAAARKKEINDKLKQLGEEFGNFAKTLVDAQYTRELNAIQDQKDAITDKTKNEIDAENRSLDSTQTKADKIAIINAKAAAQQAQLDQKQREAKQKQAQADRLFAIGKIIENTAIGVSSALAEYPPNIPLAIIVGALGAVQLGTVLATPIPKYEKGVKSHKGGPAIVGDGPGTELLIYPSGRMQLTPNTDTLMNLPAGTQVVPHMQLMGMMGAGKLQVRKDGEVVPWREMIGVLKKLDKPSNPPRVTVNVNDNFNKYRNNHFK